MSKIKYYSEGRFGKTKTGVAKSYRNRRPAIAAIGEARDKGDLSENAEYDAAKDAQGHLEAKISKLQTLILMLAYLMKVR